MTQDTRPPSPSAFIKELVLDSPHIPSDTANTGFAESPRDLDTPIVPHVDDMAPVLAYYWTVDKSVRYVGVYIYIYTHTCNIVSNIWHLFNLNTETDDNFSHKRCRLSKCPLDNTHWREGYSRI